MPSKAGPWSIVFGLTVIIPLLMALLPAGGALGTFVAFAACAAAIGYAFRLRHLPLKVLACVLAFLNLASFFLFSTVSFVAAGMFVLLAALR
jgi:hypothetical protein